MIYAAALTLKYYYLRFYCASAFSRAILIRKFCLSLSDTLWHRVQQFQIEGTATRITTSRGDLHDIPSLGSSHYDPDQSQ